MTRLTSQPWRSIRRSLLFLSAAALLSTPGRARAQQSAGHAGAAVGHPVRIAGGARPGPGAATRPARVGVPVTMPRVARGVQPVRVFSLQNSFRSIFAVPSFSEPFFFGAPFPSGFGYAGSVSQFGGMPLGFGLWPACDSAGTPGVFWTVGPCFGVGFYSEKLTAGLGTEYLLGTAPPPVYILPLIFLETQPEAGPPAEQNPSAPSPAPTMLLYLTDGRTVAATDWWIAHGRLQYVTDSGAQDSVDLSQLDLEQTIKQNQTRGLHFHLRFTPPSERYAPSERP